MRKIPFNPIQTGLGAGGGGGDCARTDLDFNNFFHKRAKPTKLGEFFNNLSGNNLGKQVFDVTMATTF